MKEIIKQIKRGLENFGLFYGKYPGTVLDHHPSNPHKLLLRIPGVWGEIVPSTIYATPSGMFSGKGYGQIITAQVGDTVWVEFKYGNPSHPIWSFMGYGSNERPKEFFNPETFGFKTPAGNMYYIDDTSGIIKIKHVDIKPDQEGDDPIPGTEIHIDNTNLEITHRDSKITIDQDKLEINTFNNILTLTEESASLELNQSNKLTISNSDQNLYEGIEELVTKLKGMLVDTPQGMGTMNQATKTELDNTINNINKILT